MKLADRGWRRPNRLQALYAQDGKPTNWIPMAAEMAMAPGMARNGMIPRSRIAPKRSARIGIRVAPNGKGMSALAERTEGPLTDHQRSTPTTAISMNSMLAATSTI